MRRPCLRWAPGAAGPVLAALGRGAGAAPWMEFALCQETDPEIFFQDQGGNTRPAKKVCMACEVRAECLGYALADPSLLGVWGGKSERERRAIRRARDREAA